MRLIARIDVKNEYVIKGIHLEGLRKIGDPNEIAKKYYGSGSDEILFMDAVASLYDRNNIFPVIEQACREVFIPITIGGGIRSIEDIENALLSGADKVAINTAAIKCPKLITEASSKYGSQCIVGSIEAKRNGDHWEVYIDNGREKTGLDVVEWAKKLELLGIGEILLTSIDYEGTKKGLDIELIEAVNSAVAVPVIASGGLGKKEHLDELQSIDFPSAVSCASVLHYNLETPIELRKHLKELGMEGRF